VVVNLSDRPAQALVRLPWADLAGWTWRLEDRLAPERFERAGDELARSGLYVALDGWGYYFMALSSEPISARAAARAELAA
jgi:hypothetical protein